MSYFAIIYWLGLGHNTRPLEVFYQFIARRRKEHNKDPHKGRFCDDQLFVLVNPRHLLEVWKMTNLRNVYLFQ